MAVVARRIERLLARRGVALSAHASGAPLVSASPAWACRLRSPNRALPDRRRVQSDGLPAMIDKGGDNLADDEDSWWWPNQACLTQLLKKLGFGKVFEAGHHTGIVRPSGYVFDRTILHAVGR